MAALSVVLFPALIFYSLLARHAINIPLLDDYNGVLEFLEHLSRLPTWAAKSGYILTAQHNEYKTIFANAVIALQYALSGHPNFILLSWLGNLFVLPLGYLLWRHFLPTEADTARRLLLFVPVSLLLFQLQYAETLNWSMPGLENIPILAFTLASIAFLVRGGSRDLLWAGAFMVLAIGTSGNGFALVPLGALLLLLRKELRRTGLWVGLGVLCAAGYFYRYNFHSSQQSSNGSVLDSVHSLNPIFTLSFMGSAVGNPHPVFQYVSVLLGAVILGILVWMAKSHYGRINPTIFSFAIFLALTALAVSGVRSKLGFDASHAGRYKIYSDLLLICCYTFLVERYWRGGRPRHRLYFLVALIASALFCGVFDLAGNRKLSTRQSDMVEGAAMYERSNHQRGPVLLNGTERTPAAIRINHLAQPIIQESESTGLYRFP